MAGPRAKYYIREHYDRPVSKKEFLRWKDQEREKLYIGQKHLLDYKLLSSGKIKAYEKQGLLASIRHRGRKYFKKDEVMALLDKSIKVIERPRQRDLFEK